MLNDDLFPAIEPYAVEYLKVSDLHTLAYEQVGNPEGTPLLFLHGGPGVGIFPDYRRYFDPSYYRVVLLDQRGAGRSTPFAELEQNTTWDIVEDLERLRQHLGIPNWLVVGGSWGSTLALCYAVRHVQSVNGLVLRGVFLARPSEMEWVHLGGGASAIYPDAWDEFASFVPQVHREKPLHAYYEMLTSDDPNVRKKAATAWARWEASIMSLKPDQAAIMELTVGDRSIALARTECHFVVNEFFMPSGNYILDNISKIANVPCEIVQGRYDIVCPVRSAWDLHKALPNSNLEIVQDGAHSVSEGGMMSAMIAATNTFKR